MRNVSVVFGLLMTTSEPLELGTKFGSPIGHKHAPALFVLVNIVHMALGPSVTNMATMRCVEILSAIFNAYGIGAEVTSEVKGNSA
jgi:hypothetical protein